MRMMVAMSSYPLGRDPAQRLLTELHARGVRQIRRVRFKHNRSRLLSVSRDGFTLYLDDAYRGAPGHVIEAIAGILSASRGSQSYRSAAAVLREWGTPRQAKRWQAAAGAGATGARMRSARDSGPSDECRGAAAVGPAPRSAACCATPAQRQFLAAAYRKLNEEHFGGRLPADLPLRLSGRMRRRLGHVRYFVRPDGGREVVELALNPDLMLEGNEVELRATLLHEMAHVEAWLVHGDRGHGAAWKRVARTVGCEPRACTTAAIRRRRPGSRPTTRVPPALPDGCASSSEAVHLNPPGLPRSRPVAGGATERSRP
jgi:hypothetical protein